MYDRVADLPLSVEDCAFDRAERATTSGFDRVTTTISLTGTGETGRGEDVTYTTAAHDALVEYDLSLAGEYTLDSFSTALDTADLWPEPPEEERFRHYRRWAFESAALDLALKQADTTLGETLNREYDPVNFVVSTRLSTPEGSPSTERLDSLLGIHDDLAFKLDPTPDWDEDVIDAVAEYDVAVLDLKGFYEDDQIRVDPDPAFYRRIADGIPDALLEDPNLTDETRPVFSGREQRVTWDMPITGIESIESLPVEPSWLNMKPSRCGTVESVLETIAYCKQQGIDLYGGGQFELGVGRDHIQALASLCYPSAPNDVAPAGYNDPDSSGSLPASPLAPPETPRGIGVGFGQSTR
jgi:hypothetical protein